MFDILTYEKGAAVLRMLEQYLGEDAFRDGIRHYLSMHQYANTETTDLWDAIEAVDRRAGPADHGHAGSSRAATRWSRPSWSATGRCGCARSGSGIRSTGDDDATTASPSVGRADPRTGGRPAGARSTARVLLTDREHDVELPEPVDWVHLNAGGSGFYRTRYRGALRDRLAEHVGELTPLERYNLVDDAFASVLPGTSTAVEFIDFARSFADDTDLVGVATPRRRARVARPHRRRRHARAAAGDRARARRAGAPSHGLVTARGRRATASRETRATLFELVGHRRRGRRRPRASPRPARRRTSTIPSSVDPAMAAAAVSVIADSGDSQEFEAFLERFRKADNPQEEMRYLYALAKFQDEDSFARMLELTPLGGAHAERAVPPRDGR